MEFYYNSTIYGSAFKIRQKKKSRTLMDTGLSVVRVTGLEEYKRLVFPLMDDLLNGIPLTEKMNSSLLQLLYLVK